VGNKLSTFIYIYIYMMYLFIYIRKMDGRRGKRRKQPLYDLEETRGSRKLK